MSLRIQLTKAEYDHICTCRPGLKWSDPFTIGLNNEMLDWVNDCIPDTHVAGLDIYFASEEDMVMFKLRASK